MLAHDPSGQQTGAINFFLKTFRPACALPVYSTAGATLDAVICGQADRREPLGTSIRPVTELATWKMP